MGSGVEEGRKTAEQGNGKYEMLRLKGDRDKRIFLVSCFL